MSNGVKTQAFCNKIKREDMRWLNSLRAATINIERARLIGIFPGRCWV